MGEREGSEGQEREGGALPFTLRDNQLGTVRPRRSERTTWSLLDHLLAFGCGRTPLTQSTKVVRAQNRGSVFRSRGREGGARDWAGREKATANVGLS